MKILLIDDDAIKYDNENNIFGYIMLMPLHGTLC